MVKVYVGCFDHLEKKLSSNQGFFFFDRNSSWCFKKKKKKKKGHQVAAVHLNSLAISNEFTHFSKLYANI